eukprot:CAMPEP_0116145840 /NCGR_PEP_ID=MMETSP0329-20121206/16838_1 /TAXON_ID=697910 /ORGANISM="Pseudo-nitzschia arenysensis, Strain B593" /LENGTH=368 /DNA_ID=CAMNT_0003641533 /DNA_START=16 /DNA_END=1122 /DNA_ORIENTATION=+
MISHLKSQVESSSVESSQNGVKKPVLKYCFPILVGALSFAKFSVISDIIEREGLLIVCPSVALSVYLGIISGWVPTPLYEGNEMWPRSYAILQLMFIVLTASRLTSRVCEPPLAAIEGIQDDDDDDDYWEYKNNMEELSDYSHWVGASLHEIFVHDNGKQLFSQEILPKLIIFALASAAAHVVNRIGVLRRMDRTNMPMPLVFLRNLMFLICIDLWFISKSFLSPESNHIEYCEKTYNTATSFIAPDLPFSQIASEFATVWKVFHPSHLHWVRLSHSILYPAILLLLTRRRLTHFVIWMIFLEIDFAHLIADMFHYVADHELADERLSFQHGPHNCFVNVKLTRELLAYPVNFLYLTTSFGDTCVDEQ